MIKTWLNEDRIGFVWCVFLLLLSVFIYPLVFIFGYNERPEGLNEIFYYSDDLNFRGFAKFGYRTYWEKINWNLYPLFFLFVAFPLYFSWFPFMNAWKELGVSNPIVRNVDGSTITIEVREKMLSEFRGYRNWLIILAVISSAIFCYFDTKELRQTYFGASYAIQLEAACEDPDFFEKWLFNFEASLNKPIKTCVDIRPYSALSDENAKALTNKDKQELFKIKKKLLNERNIGSKEAPWHQIMMTSVNYFLQFNILAIGFLILFQMMAQPIFFGVFHKLKIPRNLELIIYLNHKSPFEEFGLRKWNQATDHQFWFLFIALFIPFISRISQQPGKLDAGQHYGGILLVILVWIPTILNIASRKMWKDQSQDRAEIEGNEAIKKFNQQKIWPFDDISNKAGFVLSLIIVVSIVGKDLMQIVAG